MSQQTKQAAFTSGPWESIWDADGDHAIHADDGTLVAATSGGDCVPPEVDAANARLIAAAPDLLEALQAIRDYAANNNMTDGGDSTTKELASIASAAIAKALGGSHAE